ncbi:phage integrase SAM-like domain-containing protein [Lysinibacillus parviboronicapiens]|uniref:phage integrase SAM-like domain-containing protein n=1 Tax=Lysinibacillus parviboronicapiens TaxID=436516 RepID=UPI00142DCF27
MNTIYNSSLTFLTDHGCSTCLNEITKTQVRRFIQYLLGSLKQKPRSVNQKISSLKSFTKYCLKEQYLANDFTHGIESPKTDERVAYTIQHYSINAP